MMNFLDSIFSNVNYIPVYSVVILLQIYVQILCIRDCLGSPKYTGTGRILSITALVIFGFIAAIPYLVINSRKTLNYAIDETELKIDGNVRHVIYICLVAAYCLMALSMIREKPSDMILSLLLASTLVLTVMVHFRIVNGIKLLYLIFPFIISTLITLTEIYAESENFKIIIIITVAMIVNDYPLSYVKKFVVYPLALFIGFSSYTQYAEIGALSTDYILAFIVKNIITYSLLIFALCIAKKHILQSNYLRELTLELKEQNRRIEEISIVEERARIAREIHDTLGHSLTGAIIQLEAAKKYIDSDRDKAVASIKKSQDITRSGFNDVKRAIRALRPVIIEENTLYEALMLLFGHTENTSGMKITFEMNIPPIMNQELKVCLYRVIQELITNSLRHGKAKKIDFAAEYQDSVLRIDIKDDGKGCDSIIPGYGLTGISERIGFFNGQVFFSSEKDNGFETLLYIPVDL